MNTLSNAFVPTLTTNAPNEVRAQSAVSSIEGNIVEPYVLTSTAMNTTTIAPTTQATGDIPTPHSSSLFQGNTAEQPTPPSMAATSLFSIADPFSTTDALNFDGSFAATDFRISDNSLGTPFSMARNVQPGEIKDTYSWPNVATRSMQTPQPYSPTLPGTPAFISN